MGVYNTKLTLITSELNENLYLSCRNLNNIKFVNVNNFSVYDIINSDMLVLDKASVEKLNDYRK